MATRTGAARGCTQGVLRVGAGRWPLRPAGAAVHYRRIRVALLALTGL